MDATNLTVTNARYVYSADPETMQSTGVKTGIRATVNGKSMFIPIDEPRYYAEIMRQVEAGELTIQDAD